MITLPNFLKSNTMQYVFYFVALAAGVVFLKCRFRKAS